MQVDVGSVTAELRKTIPADLVTDDPDILATYTRDQALIAPAGDPSVLVRAKDETHVVHAIRVAVRSGRKIVTRGAGSGLSGAANAVDGCIMLCLERMDAIVDLDADEGVAVVEPGVLNADLKSAALEAGLWYPPDPASAAFSTLGGNVATNAGGLCCVKYGVTRDWVLGLRVVMADGRSIETGRRTRKDVAGYDLTGLFVGSEGTLGVVTQATLRLAPAPGARSTMAAFFPSLDAAANAIAGITRARIVPALLELLDAPTIAAIDEWKRMDLDLDAAALLIAQSDAAGSARHEEIASLEQVCRQTGATFVATTNDRDESEAFLDIRRLAYPALERLGTVLLDDVAVPRTRVPELLGAIHGIAALHKVRIATFGHAGDGNLHPTFVYDGTDEAESSRVIAAFGAVVDAALELGGSITGEHGVGSLKAPFLAKQLGDAAMGAGNAIKSALDPAHVFNVPWT